MSVPLDGISLSAAAIIRNVVFQSMEMASIRVLPRHLRDGPPEPITKPIPLQVDDYPTDIGKDMSLFNIWSDPADDYEDLFDPDLSWIKRGYTSHEGYADDAWRELIKAGVNEVKRRWPNHLGVEVTELSCSPSTLFGFKQTRYQDEHSDGNVPVALARKNGPSRVDLVFLTNRVAKRYSSENIVLLVEYTIPTSDGLDTLYVDRAVAAKADRLIRTRANSCPATGVPATVLLSIIGPFFRPYLWISNVAEGIIDTGVDGKNRSRGWIRPSDADRSCSRDLMLPNEQPDASAWLDIREEAGKRLLQGFWLDVLRLHGGNGPPEKIAEETYGAKGWGVSQMQLIVDMPDLHPVSPPRSSMESDSRRLWDGQDRRATRKSFQWIQQKGEAGRQPLSLVSSGGIGGILTEASPLSVAE